MPAERRIPKRRGLWSRLSPFERLLAATLAIIAMVGLLLIGDGIYMKAKAELAQVLLKRNFAARQNGDTSAKPWPWADFAAEAEIRAPRLNHSAIVLEGASGEALAFGPARLISTPRPGEEGTSVIAAHRDTHFRWLKDVQPGDRIEVLDQQGRTLVFRAGEGRIARWDESGIDPDAPGRHLALATCWPFEATERGPLRYIVEAELVEEQRQTAQVSAPFTEKLQPIPAKSAN